LLIFQQEFQRLVLPFIKSKIIHSVEIIKPEHLKFREHLITFMYPETGYMKVN